MLTSAQSIVVYENGRARPDRLTRKSHGHYRDHAEKMLAVYADGVGRTRRELRRQVEAIFSEEADCDPRRVQAFCKLLDDAGSFDADRKGAAAQLRLQVFTRAAAYHPLVERRDKFYESEESEIKQKIAAELGRTWDEIDQALYADVIDYHRLRAFHGYDNPAALLAHYNVAQVQACLYRALSMTVDATSDFKTILRYAKLAGLLHLITRLGPSRYRIVFTGPASVLRSTRSYGVKMAQFLPALLACEGWRLNAEIETPRGWRVKLELSPEDRLQASLPPLDEFDSDLERKFAKRFGDERDGWSLARESEIVHAGQKAFIPDFVFTHKDGTRVLFEIVGFWTPEYLTAKVETLSMFQNHNVVIAAPESSAKLLKNVSERMVIYKTAIRVEKVMEVLEEARKIKA